MESPVQEQHQSLCENNVQLTGEFPPNSVPMIVSREEKIIFTSGLTGGVIDFAMPVIEETVCSIKCCSIDCKNTQQSRPDLQFFTLPCDPSKCLLWVMNAGRPDLWGIPIQELHKTFYLCENHFKHTIFKKKQLMPSAVPTAFSQGRNIYNTVLPDRPVDSPSSLLNCWDYLDEYDGDVMGTMCHLCAVVNEGDMVDIFKGGKKEQEILLKLTAAVPGIISDRHCSFPLCEAYVEKVNMCYDIRSTFVHANIYVELLKEIGKYNLHFHVDRFCGDNTHDNTQQDIFIVKPVMNEITNGMMDSVEPKSENYKTGSISPASLLENDYMISSEEVFDKEDAIKCKNKTLYCTHCFHVFPDQKLATEHMKELKMKGEHVGVTMKNYRAMCKYCGQLFLSRMLFIEHLNMHKLLERTCNICNLVYKNDRSLKSHLGCHKYTHGFKCFLCRNFYNDNASLSNHKANIHEICTVCNKVFRNKKRLALHIKLYHKKITCKICSRPCPNVK